MCVVWVGWEYIEYRRSSWADFSTQTTPTPISGN